MRPLPRSARLETLLSHPGHLQTVALLCPEAERAGLAQLSSRTGAVRVTSGDKMSATYCGAPHDGAFPLRSCCNIMSYEF